MSLSFHTEGTVTTASTLFDQLLNVNLKGNDLMWKKIDQTPLSLYCFENTEGSPYCLLSGERSTNASKPRGQMSLKCHLCMETLPCQLVRRSQCLDNPGYPDIDLKLAIYMKMPALTQNRKELCSEEQPVLSHR